nr:PREDICTED: uncharacterized protein LOC102363230 isoform X2 [Latimeria chalumnae]|eukprot:XP_014348337.1 PREDICTED: uncharacterized protein LOC102363230 isoform X2 [Latimeria chalumnae]
MPSVQKRRKSRKARKTRRRSQGKCKKTENSETSKKETEKNSDSKTVECGSGTEFVGTYKNDSRPDTNAINPPQGTGYSVSASAVDASLKKAPDVGEYTTSFVEQGSAGLGLIGLTKLDQVSVQEVLSGAGNGDKETMVVKKKGGPKKKVAVAFEKEEKEDANQPSGNLSVDTNARIQLGNGVNNEELEHADLRCYPTAITTECLLNEEADNDKSMRDIEKTEGKLPAKRKKIQMNTMSCILFDNTKPVTNMYTTETTDAVTVAQRPGFTVSSLSSAIVESMDRSDLEISAAGAELEKKILNKRQQSELRDNNHTVQIGSAGRPIENGEWSEECILNKDSKETIRDVQEDVGKEKRNVKKDLLQKLRSLLRGYMEKTSSVSVGDSQSSDVINTSSDSKINGDLKAIKQESTKFDEVESERSEKGHDLLKDTRLNNFYSGKEGEIGVAETHHDYFDILEKHSEKPTCSTSPLHDISGGKKQTFFWQCVEIPNSDILQKENLKDSGSILKRLGEDIVGSESSVFAVLPQVGLIASPSQSHKAAEKEERNTYSERKHGEPMMVKPQRKKRKRGLCDSSNNVVEEKVAEGIIKSTSKLTGSMNLETNVNDDKLQSMKETRATCNTFLTKLDQNMPSCQTTLTTSRNVSTFDAQDYVETFKDSVVVFQSDSDTASHTTGTQEAEGLLYVKNNNKPEETAHGTLVFIAEESMGRNEIQLCFVSADAIEVSENDKDQSTMKCTSETREPADALNLENLTCISSKLEVMYDEGQQLKEVTSPSNILETHFTEPAQCIYPCMSIKHVYIDDVSNSFNQKVCSSYLLDEPEANNGVQNSEIKDETLGQDLNIIHVKNELRSGLDTGTPERPKKMEKIIDKDEDLSNTTSTSAQFEVVIFEGSIDNSEVNQNVEDQSHEDASILNIPSSSPLAQIMSTIVPAESENPALKYIFNCSKNDVLDRKLEDDKETLGEDDIKLSLGQMTEVEDKWCSRKSLQCIEHTENTNEDSPPILAYVANERKECDGNTLDFTGSDLVKAFCDTKTLGVSKFSTTEEGLEDEEEGEVHLFCHQPHGVLLVYYQITGSVLSLIGAYDGESGLSSLSYLEEFAVEAEEEFYYPEEEVQHG